MNEPAAGKPKFIYVTYIRTTADKLWAALTEPEFTRRFWFDTTQESMAAGLVLAIDGARRADRRRG